MITGEFGVYLLKVSALLILLYIFNKLLLGRETLHRLNRFAWLATLLLSFTIPLLSLPQETIINTHNIETGDITHEVVESMETATQAPIMEGIVKIIFWIYIFGAVAVLLYNIISYISLLRFITTKKYDILASQRDEDIYLRELLSYCQSKIGIERSVRYIIHDQEEYSPFSWMNFVVVSRKDMDTDGRDIIMHELSHVKQQHSIDILLVNIVTTILWFNPASWLTKRAMQQVHEYCADESVLTAGVNAKEYQLLLIKKAVGSRLYSVSNSLNHSNLKNRITMMLQKKSPKMAGVKLLYAIPMTFIAVAIFSLPAVAEATSAITRVKITNKSDNYKAEEPPQEAKVIEDGSIIKVADISNTADNSSRPLYVVNGEVVESIDKIDKNNIKSISVIKKDHKGYADLKVWEQEDITKYDGIIFVTLEGSKSAAFIRTEVMPKFEDGDLLKFSKWVSSHLCYPKEDFMANIQGTVITSFVIDPDGTLSSIEIIKSPSAALSNEVQRVLMSSPKWTPGEQRGEKVAIKYTLPVVFSINNEETK